MEKFSDSIANRPVSGDILSDIESWRENDNRLSTRTEDRGSGSFATIYVPAKVSLSHTLSFSISPSLSLRHTHSLSLSFSIFPSLSLTHTHSLFLSLFFPLSLSFSYTLSLSFSISPSLTHAHSLSLSLYFSLSAFSLSLFSFHLSLSTRTEDRGSRSVATMYVPAKVSLLRGYTGLFCRYMEHYTDTLALLQMHMSFSIYRGARERKGSLL